VWALLAAAFGLRLWGLRHGLPFAYNVDEASNFVPTAISYFFSGTYDPNYFVNPPAFSYLLHGIYAVWFGGGWPLGAKWDAGHSFATDPARAFELARITSAVLGTAAIGFVYLTGARLFDRRTGFLAALVMSVSFLPVFYSHLALNDVPALLPLTVSMYGSAGILTRGRLRDYAIAGLGLGLAAATKYTAGICVLPLVAAAAVHAADRERRRTVLRGGVLAAGLAVVGFVVANPYSLASFGQFWSDVRSQESTAGFGKLGVDYDSGISYYLWVLTWGLGWVPLAGGFAGAALLARLDPRRALFLVPLPVVFTLYMGLQERYFGRWLLPAFPALALLAACAAVWAADRLGRTARLRTALLVGFGVALAGQGLVYTVHVDRVLARDDTRALARSWMERNVPAAAKVVVEPVVPDSWFTPQGSLRGLSADRARRLTPGGRLWVKFPTGRTQLDTHGHKLPGGKGRNLRPEDYERITRPALLRAYERGGYCWVMIGSTQYGRALAAAGEVPDAIAYYRELARRGDLVYRTDPYRAGKPAQRFNFDWSFDYYPLSYERPGPAVRIYRLRQAACARG
jgi:hypothetical protein